MKKLTFFKTHKSPTLIYSMLTINPFNFQIRFQKKPGLWDPFEMRVTILNTTFYKLALEITYCRD